MIEHSVEVNDLLIKIGRKTVLDNININFQKGESVLIGGRNGAGKSTFLKCLGSVILPDKGQIVFSKGTNKNKIGYISDKMSLFEDFSLKKGIDFHASACHIDKFDDSLIKKMKFDQNQKIKNLSAGERVLFHLALIVAQKPEILLIDEIIHTIDTYMRTLFLETIIDLMDKFQTTVIMINHTFSEVEKIPERILLMEQGRFILDERSEDLRKKIKKVVTKDTVSQDLPRVFQVESPYQNEYFIYPFKEEFRTAYPYEYVDLDLNEIMKAFIGGQYVKEGNL